MEAQAAPTLTAAPETPEPMGAGEAATLADKLAAELARRLGEIAEDTRKELTRILHGQTRKTLIDLVLDVVARDGLGAVDLAEIVKATRPVSPTTVSVPAAAKAKPGPKPGPRP